MNLLDLLGGPLKGIVDSVGSLIDGLHTSDEEKLEAKVKLAEMERNFQLAIMQAETDFAKHQAQVVSTEIQSNSWLGRNWRPILMLTFTYIIAHNFVVAPLFGLEYLEIPIPMWDLLKIGIGGYIFGRSAEKIVPETVRHFKNKDKSTPLGTPVNK